MIFLYLIGYKLASLKLHSMKINSDNNIGDEGV